MVSKRSIFTIIILLITITCFAQAPNQINYQGVARNASGISMSNKNIAIRASIRHSAVNGAIVYSEVRYLTTNADGLFNFMIDGPGGESITGSWSAINWANGNKLLQIEMDTNGGNNFINMGTQQFVSVPYAQHANKADGLTSTGTMSIGAVAGDVLQFNGTNWAAATLIDGLDLPYLLI
jgi:hypothetical protein